MATGTSNGVIVSDDGLKARPALKPTEIKGWTTDSNGKSIKIHPPALNPDNVGFAITNDINPYPEFAFNKLTPPDYGNTDSLARITGIPDNKPDMIGDYHYISLMRIVDKLATPQYDGKINATVETPQSNS